MKEQYRIGTGYDVHRFAHDPERKLWLGGLLIAEGPGLAGHSDADVLLHSITDAVLGALAWGDIGGWFPDTDDRYLGADSKKLFAEVWSKAAAEGWALVNCDATVVAEKPRLFPHVEAIRGSIAVLFTADVDQISVKATTNEKMGFIGRGEGMAAHSVVMLGRASEA